MLLEKIAQIRSAIDQGLPYPALALALTIPDICSRIQFGVGDRDHYAKWYDQYVHPYMHFSSDKQPDMTDFRGIDCYRLRCEFLHNGEGNSIDVKGRTSYTDFHLSTDDSQGAAYVSDMNGRKFISYLIISIPVLCRSICVGAESFYDTVDAKSVFDDPHIIMQ